MKTLTMVMRCGDPKASAENMHYTLIGEDYSFERMSGAALANAIKAKKVEVTNMGVSEKGLIATNGAIKNYTLIDPAGNLVGVPRAVILNRVELNDKLLGYTIYNQSGVLQEVTTPVAAQMATAGLIANGKIRHTQTGDIVASINGFYPLRVMKYTESTKMDITVDVMFIGSAIKGRHMTKYAGLIVNGADAASISKVHKKLEAENKKLIDKMHADYAEPSEDSFKIKVTGTAGMYGVYPIDTAFELIEKAKNNVGLPMGKLMIACTDYDSNKDEATVVLSSTMKPLGKQTGSAKANEVIKKYTEEILTKLNGVTIKASK